jgi:hypothetical protein
MTSPIDANRTEMLVEVRAKREAALRLARTLNAREEEYWLGIAGRMTTWIEHLEKHGAMRAVPMRANHGGGRTGIELPPNARPRPLPVPADASDGFSP